MLLVRRRLPALALLSMALLPSEEALDSSKLRLGERWIRGGASEPAIIEGGIADSAFNTGDSDREGGGEDAEDAGRGI